MELGAIDHGGSGEFRNFAPYGDPPDYDGGYGGSNSHQIQTIYSPWNVKQSGFQHSNVIGYQPSQPSQPETRKVYEKRTEGLTKMRNAGIVNIALAVITCAVGVAILTVASSNIGFPVFNFGVLLAGIIHLVVGILCYLTGKNGLASITADSLEIPTSIKCYILAQFVVSVALTTFAILAAVIAFISGAVCAGADITFQSKNNGVVKEVDVKQYCEPNKDANTILAFFGGTLCVLIGIRSVCSTAWVCCYGTLFGWRRRG